VPAMPVLVWVGGAASLALLMLVRAFRFARIFKTAYPATAAVRAQVDRAGATMGLLRVPDVVMVSDRVSPMIWCGRRTRLVLPQTLWDELDEVGRAAVLHHELAHLRRRDHWVCRAELFVCLLYWWNPLVWWVRRRIREEADMCCDAWVTSLMPRERRAYAQALLQTSRFISQSRLRPPAVGLGVTTIGAQRFARRLTMVMTQRTTPRRSIPGLILALTLGAGGLVAAPIWACPPEESEQHLKEHQAEMHAKKMHEHQAKVEAKARATATSPKAPKAPKPPKAPKAPRAALAPLPPLPPMPPMPPRAPMSADDMSTFERHMAERSQAPQAQPGHSDGGDIDAKLRRLEEKLEQMNQRLQELGQSPRKRSSLNADTIPGMALFSATEVAPDGKVVILSYRLPEGKAEALCQLMLRDDVPVLVRPLDEGIEVHGTAQQHAAMRAFLAVIHPGESQPSLDLQGQNPINALSLNYLAQARDYAALAELQAIPHRSLTNTLTEHQAKAEAHAQAAARVRARADELRAKAEGVARRADELRGLASRATDEDRARAEADADALAEQADALREQADDLSEQADCEEATSDDLRAEAQALAEEAASLAAIEAPAPAEAPDEPETP